MPDRRRRRGRHAGRLGQTPVADLETEGLQPARNRSRRHLPDGVSIEEPKAALFQTVNPAGRRLTGRALDRRLVLAMVKSPGVYVIGIHTRPGAESATASVHLAAEDSEVVGSGCCFFAAAASNWLCRYPHEFEENSEN